MPNVVFFVGSLCLFLIQSSFADETVIKGVVIDNNMEDPSIGAYLHIRKDSTGEDIIAVYTPYEQGFEAPCQHKINAFLVAAGDAVEVRGTPIEELGGIQVTTIPVLTTCLADSAYIKIIRRSKGK